MEEKQKFSKKIMKNSIYEKWSEPGNEYTSVRRHPGDRNGYFKLIKGSSTRVLKNENIFGH